MNRQFLLLPLLAVAAVSCTSITPHDEVRERVDAVSETRLRATVEELCALGPRPAGDLEATERTLVELERRLAAWGYTTEREAFVDVLYLRTDGHDSDGERVTFLEVLEDAEQHNLIAELRGSMHPEEVIEICAHYDTVGRTAGADDNTSGVAGVLEIARVLRDVTPARTIRFVFFASEETGLQGSTAHVAAMTAEERENFVALIDLEMIGYADSAPDTQDAPVYLPIIGFGDTADFVSVLGTFSTGWLGNYYEAAIDAYVPELPYWSGNRIGGFFADARRSDHAPYWDAGLPAIMISDTSEFRNDNYHRPSDTPETLDYEFMRRITQATLAAAVHLADR